MSIRVMTQVWDLGPTDRSELLILLALADFSNDQGECWPSVKSLAAKARTSERGAQKIVARLVEAGWLEIKTGGGRGGTNIYRIEPIRERAKTPNGVHPEQDAPPEPCSGISAQKNRTGEHKPRTGVQETPNPGSPEPSRTIKKPSRATRAHTQAPAREDLPEGFEDFWQAYPRAKNREASKEVFAEAVRSGVDPSRIVAAADGYRAEKSGEPRRYLCASDAWLSQRRWESRTVATAKTTKSGTSGDIIGFWAEKVIEGAYIPVSAISSAMAHEMLRRNLVTSDQLRAAGCS